MTTTENGSWGHDPEFDDYDRVARLWPALAAILPVPVAAVILSITDFSTWGLGGLGTLGVAAVASLTVMSIAREAGTRAQTRIWHKDSSSPLVQRLRWRSGTRAETSAAHEVVERAVGFDLPTEELERTDPAEADGQYRNAERALRAVTRNVDYAPLRRELKRYGFVRNLYGLRPVWRTSSVLTLVIATGVAITTDNAATRAGAALVMLGAVAYGVSLNRWLDADAVRHAGAAYADALLETCRGAFASTAAGPPAGVEEPAPMPEPEPTPEVAAEPMPDVFEPEPMTEAEPTPVGAEEPAPVAEAEPGPTPVSAFPADTLPEFPTVDRRRLPPRLLRAGRRRLLRGGRRARANGGMPAEVDERRLQADVYANGKQLRHAFLAGVTHDVEVSIGHLGSIRAGVRMPAIPFPQGVDRVPLIVRFLASDAQERRINLPRDPTRESDIAHFTLAVDPGAKERSAVIAVFLADQPDRVVHAGVLRGPVVADASDEPSAAGIKLDGEIPVADAVTTLTSGVQASLLVTGDQAVVTTDGKSERVDIDLSSLKDRMELLAERISNGADLIHGGDPDALESLLVDLAANGRELRAKIVDGLPDGIRRATHVQVVAATEGEILPLELVYDGPALGTKSRLCPTWKPALENDTCAGCAGGGPDADASKSNPRVCPMRFWSMSKVIERHALLKTKSGDFLVRSERREGREKLSPLTPSVVGASKLIHEHDMTTTIKMAKTCFGATARPKSWKSWRSMVKKKGPGVLVAIVHNESDSERDPPVDALELSGRLLDSGSIDWTLMKREERGLGALVLLIGCHTGAGANKFTSFAQQFRQNGAPIVISTIGDVLSDQAPIAVQKLMAQLAEQRTRAGSIGEAVRSTRRMLLADEIVLGLLLVTHGDADWTFGG